MVHQRRVSGMRGYRIHGRATSSNVQALLWGMEELGLAYDRIDRGESYGGLDTAGFRALNPHGRIPVLQLPDGRGLFETGAILRYLAGQHGTDPFWPRDPVARARVDMWAEWAKYQVASAFTVPIFWAAVRRPESERDLDAIADATTRFEDALATGMAEIAKHGFLCGADLSLADIQFGHVLYRYFDAGLAQREIPGLSDYYTRLCTRPAYRKAVMVPYDALRGLILQEED